MKRIAFVLLILLASLRAAHAATEVVPFIQNDYAKALAEARAQKRPLFIEVWTAWCHRCSWMRAYVFTDRALAPYAGRFVWLGIDAEDARNSAFTARFPLQMVPMIMIVEPARGSVVLRYAGGTTVPQLTQLLDDGERKVRGSQASAADLLLERADRLAASGRSAAARAAYERALAGAPATWSRAGRAAEGYLLVLQLANLNARCATAARDLYPRVKGTPSAAKVVGSGLSCAVALERTDRHRLELLTALRKATRETIDARTIDLTTDNRSELYQLLIDGVLAMGDTGGAAMLQQEWAAFLEQAAAAAASPDQRAVFDAHRLDAYVALHTPEKAVAMLTQSERDFPDDYNPPARLATAYRAMKRYDAALDATGRALAHAYGPSKVDILTTRADLQAEMGNRAASTATIRDAIGFAKSLPREQQDSKAIADLEARLAATARQDR